MGFVIDLVLGENATLVGHPRLGLAVGTFACPALHFLCPHGHARGVTTAVTGKELIGSVTEVFFHGTLPHAGKAHSIASGDAWVTIPATARLRAEVSGRKPLVKSPILANAALIDFITHLPAEDLLKWETFEKTKRMLEEATLVFRSEPVP